MEPLGNRALQNLNFAFFSLKQTVQEFVTDTKENEEERYSQNMIFI